MSLLPPYYIWYAPVLTSYHQILKAFFSGHGCFLDRPNWKRLSARLTSDALTSPVPSTPEPVGFVSPRWAEYHDSYFLLLAEMPSVLRVGYNVRKDRKRGVAPDPGQMEELMPRAERLRAAFLAWHAEARATGAISDPVELAPSDPASAPFDTVLRFRTPWEGAAVMGYWANILILQECINQCQRGAHVPFGQSNRRLATDILRAIEHVGQGLMGPYRVGHPLRVAYDFVDRPVQIWALRMVEKYNKQYAAMSSEVYPDNSLIRGDDDGHQDGQARPADPLSWV